AAYCHRGAPPRTTRWPALRAARRRSSRPTARPTHRTRVWGIGRPSCRVAFARDLASLGAFKSPARWTVDLKAGAQERTRTSTPLRAPAPEAGASTNSATWALVAVGRPRRLRGAAPPCQSRNEGASARPMIEPSEQLVTIFGGA